MISQYLLTPFISRVSGGGGAFNSSFLRKFSGPPPIILPLFPDLQRELHPSHRFNQLRHFQTVLSAIQEAYFSTFFPIKFTFFSKILGSTSSINFHLFFAPLFSKVGEIFWSGAFCAALASFVTKNPSDLLRKLPLAPRTSTGTPPNLGSFYDSKAEAPVATLCIYPMLGDFYHTEALG